MPGIRSVRLLDVFRTATFRLAFLYLLLFAVSILLVLGFIYLRTAGTLATLSDEAIRAEVQGLGEQYKRRLMPGLQGIIKERAQNPRNSLYLLASGDIPLAGNLSGWPPDAVADGQDWINFKYVREDDPAHEVRPGRAFHYDLPGGYRLLVGRDTKEVSAISDAIRQTLMWAIGIAGLVGIIGGMWISRNVLRRLETINRASRDIMSGRSHAASAGDGERRRTGRLGDEPEPDARTDRAVDDGYARSRRQYRARSAHALEQAPKQTRRRDARASVGARKHSMRLRVRFRRRTD